ncbi:MAG: hypothetical protein MSD82_13075 [Prevotella sp.]|nr:hypothetical protein [Prevotella sp.]
MKEVLICLLTLLPVIAAAQETRRHEVGISIGCGPNDADMKVNNMIDLLSDKYQMEEDFTDSGLFGITHGTVSVDYLYRFSHRWAAGGLFGWGYGGGNFADYNFPDNPQTDNPTDKTYFLPFRTGHLLSRSFYMLPFARYSWYVTDNRVFRCYSKVALGYMRQVCDFRPDRDMNPQRVDELKSIYHTYQRFTYHVTVGGIEFGHQRIRLYSELGYGCQGFLNVGMKVAL